MGKDEFYSDRIMRAPAVQGKCQRSAQPVRLNCQRYGSHEKPIYSTVHHTSRSYYMALRKISTHTPQKSRQKRVKKRFYGAWQPAKQSKTPIFDPTNNATR